MPIGEQICREMLAVPVPNEDVAALLFQSLPRLYGSDSQVTALPREMALGVIRNSGVAAAVLQARSATDPEVIERLVSDPRLAVKEIMAARDDLADLDYQRLWTFAYAHQRAEILELLASRVDPAWVLGENLFGHWITRNICDILAQRVIDAEDPELLTLALAQERPELVARTLVLVAARDLDEFAGLLATGNFNQEVLKIATESHYCCTSNVARILIGYLTPEYKGTRDFKALVRGWNASTYAEDLLDATMELINDATFTVADIVMFLGRGRAAWTAISAQITESLNGDPRLWAVFLRLADTRSTLSLPDLLAETLATA